MKAIVIGGGIGGLAAVIALQKAGIEAHTYERAPALREIGAGISLWANAIHALDELGLADAIRSPLHPSCTLAFELGAVRSCPQPLRMSGQSAWPSRSL